MRNKTKTAKKSQGVRRQELTYNDSLKGEGKIQLTSEESEILISQYVLSSNDPYCTVRLPGKSD